MPMIIEGTNLEMKEQLEVANMTGQLMGTNSELYETRENDMTQERDNIFMWKKVEMSCNNPEVIYTSMQPHTPSNGSDIDSVSTGIDALSMLSHRGDSDGPMTASSGIDTASLSDLSLGSGILETLPSSLGGLGHDRLQITPQQRGKMLLQRATMEKEVAESMTTRIRMEASTRDNKDSISEGEHMHLQYTEGGRGRGHTSCGGWGRSTLGCPPWTR